MIYVWLAVVVISTVVEFATEELVSVWFIGGGLVALVLAAVHLELIWQILGFIVISALLLIFCRKPIMKYLTKNKEKTNVDCLIGKEYTLLTPISFGQLGTVKVRDVVWNATSQSGEEIKEGVVVEVVKISGNKLIVKEKE